MSEMADLYERVKRPPRDGSISAASTVHAQACGFVAWVFDVHPDRVAEAVRDADDDDGWPTTLSSGMSFATFNRLAAFFGCSDPAIDNTSKLRAWLLRDKRREAKA